jgi:plasmid replication initiation protein
MTESTPVFIQKAHELVNAKYAFSLQEMRVFLKMLTLIGNEDADFQKYSFKVKDFAHEFGIKSKDIYGELEALTDGLLKKIIKIPIRKNGKEKVFKTTLVSSFEYFKDGSGVVTASFHPMLKPYLLQLKTQYLRYDLKNVLRLSSSHAIRLYELLKQFESSGYRIIPLQELKELLGVADKYDRYYNFKVKVLEYGKKSLSQHTDISFDYQEILTGKQITQLEFRIRKNGAVTELPVAPAVWECLRRWKMETDVGLIDRLKPRPEPVILEVRKKVEQQFKQISKRGLKIQHPTAYLRKLIMNQSLFEQTEKRLCEKPVETVDPNLKNIFEQELADKMNKLRAQYLTTELQEQVLERLQKNPLQAKLLQDERYVQAQLDRHLQKTYLQKREYTFDSRVKQTK